MIKIKQGMFRFIVLIVALAVNVVSTKVAAQDRFGNEQVLRLSTGEWAPYIEQHQLGYGPVSRVVLESFKNVGVTPMVRFWPWSRAMASVTAGQVDASYAWSKTDARLEEFHYSDSFYETRNVFFYRKGFTFDWANISDLAKYELGGVQDYAYDDALLEAEEQGKVTITRVVSERQLVLLLMAGRIDAFPAEELVGRELFKEYAPGRMKDFSVHPKALKVRRLYVIARKTDEGERLLTHFNRGLKMLKDSGRYQVILDF